MIRIIPIWGKFFYFRPYHHVLNQATMLKPTLLLAILVFCLGASNIALAQSSVQNRDNVANRDLKFLDDIAIEAVNNPDVVQAVSRPSLKTEAAHFAKRSIRLNRPAPTPIERATALQFKYAMMLDIEVELINNLNLFKLIDEWYGTRYRYGGVSKSGIDCSALMQIFFTALYGVALPRTAREQYQFSRRISRTELQEGDLVFFNTTGGVSHVGFYLTNNKFVHASSSGVMISDLYDDYYARRFIGAGRVDEIDSPEGYAFIQPKP